jgi:hypothetical protein
MMSPSSDETLGLQLLNLSVASLITGSRWVSSNSFSRDSAVDEDNSPGLVAIASTSLLTWKCSSSLVFMVFMLVELPVRFVNEFAILATLSLRIIVEAEVRTRCSLRDRAVIPGKGRILRLQTSESCASRRARSPRGGANIGILEVVVRSD